QFKSRIGIKSLLFEHSSWLSIQFRSFGELFENAVRQGLTAIQTQHPGFYYQQAANHAMTRRKVSQESCQQAVAYPQEDPLKPKIEMEYYGQRPWRPNGKLLTSLVHQVMIFLWLVMNLSWLGSKNKYHYFLF